MTAPSAPTYTLHILMGQRTCRYEGEYAPESLGVADENTMSDNPSYMENLIAEYRNSPEFSAVRLIQVKLPYAAIEAALALSVKIPGEISQS